MYLQASLYRYKKYPFSQIKSCFAEYLHTKCVAGLIDEFHVSSGVC